MFRVLFTNVPDNCSDEEVYDYITVHSHQRRRGHQRESADPIVNALRIPGLGASGGGAVFVDYATRAAA